MSAANLIEGAFLLGRQRNQDLARRWVAASFHIGGLLPRSSLTVSVQRVGELDIVIRCMEDELKTQDPNEIGFKLNYLVTLSEIWIGSAYEIVRLLSERELAPQNAKFQTLSHELRLLRVPIEKHQIAADNRIDGEIVLETGPVGSDNIKEYVYKKEDKDRSYVVPTGITERFSVEWVAIDTQNGRSFWIERRYISDKFLSIWSHGDSNEGAAP